MHAGGVLSSLSILRTPEAWSEISQGYAFFAYPWHFTHTNDRTPAGVRGVRDTLSGCAFWSCRRIPGVRKKRVPLANFLAPLRGALACLRREQNGETSARWLKLAPTLTRQGGFARSPRAGPGCSRPPANRRRVRKRVFLPSVRLP